MTFWKVFSMNGDFSKGIPMYLDDTLDNGLDAAMKNRLSINEKVVKQRTLDTALTDKYLNSVLNLYNGYLRINIDQRLDLADREVV